MRSRTGSDAVAVNAVATRGRSVSITLPSSRYAGRKLSPQSPTQCASSTATWAIPEEASRVRTSFPRRVSGFVMMTRAVPSAIRRSSLSLASLPCPPVRTAQGMPAASSLRFWSAISESRG